MISGSTANHHCVHVLHVLVILYTSDTLPSVRLPESYTRLVLDGEPNAGECLRYHNTPKIDQINVTFLSDFLPDFFQFFIDKNLFSVTTTHSCDHNNVPWNSACQSSCLHLSSSPSFALMPPPWPCH